MARNRTLQSLLSDLRDELRRINSSSAAPDDVGPLRRTINHVYALTYLSHDWKFLETNFPAITLNAGQRYYDFPEGLDPDRVIEAKVRWSGDFCTIERGISFDDYNAHDSELDERNAPILKWDVRFTGEKEQIEVWPIPNDDAQDLRFFGIWAHAPLVNDNDVCRLDSEMLVLYAAAELLEDDSPDKKPKQQMAQEMLRLLKVRSASAGSKVYRLGLGSYEDKPHPRATVRISG